MIRLRFCLRLRLRDAAAAFDKPVFLLRDNDTLTVDSVNDALRKARLELSVIALVGKPGLRAIAILSQRHPVFGVSITLERFENDGASIRRRYPRLLAAMKWVAILSEGEAVGATLDAREGRTFGCEAVNHFGGTFKVVRAGFKARHSVRALEAEEGRRRSQQMALSPA